MNDKNLLALLTASLNEYGSVGVAIDTPPHVKAVSGERMANNIGTDLNLVVELPDKHLVIIVAAVGNDTIEIRIESTDAAMGGPLLDFVGTLNIDDL